MKKLTSGKYDELCSKAQVVEKDGFGYKVLLLKNGEMVKIFRRKHLISSALFRPYAKRFKRNAEGLLKRVISTVKLPSYIIVHPRHVIWCFTNQFRV